MEPLKGVSVLDLSKVIAGPLCGQWLGDLGADVVKVEPVEGGDESRAWPPQKDGHAATFLSLNRNKRSIALDLKTEKGRKIVHRLAEKADIVIQGFGTGAAERLGVDHATLSRIKPDLIYCEISGFGRTGPLGDRPGYDVMMQAFSGMMSTMGEPGGNAVRASFSPIDQGTAMHALSGILAALIERSQTRRGVYVEVSLLDTAVGFLGYMAANFWLTGALPQRMGSGHPALCPYQAFVASDGELLVAVGNDAQWKRFCFAVGLEDIYDDPRFRTNVARVAHFRETVALVQAKIRERPVAHWVDSLTAAKVPCAAINMIDVVLSHPQLAARKIVVEDQHPVLGTIRNIGYPVSFDREERRSRSSPPLHGQHTAEILKSLGYRDAEIADLAEDGVVLLNAASCEA